MKCEEKRLPVSRISSSAKNPDEEVLSELQQQCYVELVSVVNGIAGALDVSASSIMNMVAIRTMSQRMPTGEQEMLKIPHVTKANFDKYGKALLDVTIKFAQEKSGECTVHGVTLKTSKHFC